MADLKATFARIDSFKIGEIAKLSGLSRGAIIDIRTGKTTNPGILTMEKLHNALDQLEGKTAHQDVIKPKSRKSAETAAKAAAK